MPEKLKFSLIENAHDFITFAAECAQKTDRRYWKHALLNLGSALELLMKAILEKEHWALLFENVDVASKDKLNKGNFKSVDFETTLSRLKEISGIKIPIGDEKYLKKIRDIRNKITHFSIEINLEELKSVVARGLNIFINFYENAFEEHDESFVIEINKMLVEFQKFVDLRMANLKPKLDASEKPSPQFSDCPECFQTALVIEGSDVVCLYCGAQTTIEDLADYSEGPGGPCPNCGDGFLGFILYNNEDGDFICTKCGYKTAHNYNDECTSCGSTFWNKNGDIMCKDCWRRLAEKE